MGMILILIFLCACQVYILYWVPAHQLRGEVIGDRSILTGFLMSGVWYALFFPAQNT
jgi:hypothetical protein